MSGWYQNIPRFYVHEEWDNRGMGVIKMPFGNELRHDEKKRKKEHGVGSFGNAFYEEIHCGIYTAT